MIDQSHIGLLTIPEAAAVAEVQPGTIRQWVVRYGLPTVLGVDGRTLISERAVLDCEHARRVETRGRRRAS